MCHKQWRTFFLRLIAILPIFYLSCSFLPRNDAIPRHPKKQCGAIYFYHVPKTGGTSIRDWLKKICAIRKSSCEYVELFWGHPQIAEFKNNWTLHRNTVEENLEKIGKEKAWYVFHHHWFQKGMNQTFPYFEKWKSTVEKKQCQFLAFTMIRDPLQKIFSQLLFDKIDYENLHEEIEQNKRHVSQIDNFLYNSEDEIPDISLESKIRRGIEILRHFQISLTCNLDNLRKVLQSRTGFQEVEIPHSNSQRVHTRSYDLVYSDLQRIWKSKCYKEDKRWYVEVMKAFDL